MKQNNKCLDLSKLDLWKIMHNLDPVPDLQNTSIQNKQSHSNLRHHMWNDIKILTQT